MVFRTLRVIMRKKFRLCRLWNRFVIGVVLTTIVLVIYIKHKADLYISFKLKECEKLVLNTLSDTAKKLINFGYVKQPQEFSSQELRRWILNENAREKVLNLDLYGPVTNNTLIFVVQVHQYSCNINYLLASFSELEGIEDVLIIFSHSYVDHNINRLIQSIEYCRILQLFYPYSLQAYPDEFPGYDKNDCQPVLNMRAAKKINCAGALTPDVRGRYRNPIDTEKKHNWWWTANKVFGNLSHTDGLKGFVVFLEDNFYIHKNFIFITHQMKNIAETLPQCDFLSFGSISDVSGENAYSFEFTNWDPKYHSNLMAIDATTWRSIALHYDIFCNTDDISWSRSLFEISINRQNGKMFKVLSSVTSRALRTDPCSSSHVMDCHVVEKIVEILDLQRVYKEVLFPPYFEILYDIQLYDDELTSVDYIESNGGWSDFRDKQLCSNMTIKNASKSMYVENKGKELNADSYWL